MVDFLFLYNNNNLTGLHYIKNTNNLIKQKLYMDHEDHDETAHLVASKKIMTAENQKSIGLSREQNAQARRHDSSPKHGQSADSVARPLRQGNAKHHLIQRFQLPLPPPHLETGMRSGLNDRDGRLPATGSGRGRRRHCSSSRRGCLTCVFISTTGWLHY